VQQVGVQPSRTPRSHRAARGGQALRTQAHFDCRRLKRQPCAQHFAFMHQPRIGGARVGQAVGDHRDGENRGEGKQGGDDVVEHSGFP